MNLREETIKVLRDTADFIKDRDAGEPANETGWASDEGLDLWISMNNLLSRLEVGSGEETVDIVFDGPPSHESGRFVEVESPPGTSVNFGEWVHRSDGYWALRFKRSGEEMRLRKALADIAAYKGEPVYDASGTLEYTDYSSALEMAHVALNQEGGGASETQNNRPSDGRTDASGGHVATPAPGENSERANLELRLTELANAIERKSPSLALHDSRLVREAIRSLSTSYAAGRRSMRKKAARVVSQARFGEIDSDLRSILAAIRAIPEK